MALALYRKYRPATFAEVVGQEHVTAPLMTAVDSGRINHAYLFSGPRGCGKTSSARILARSLNCEQGPTSQPCGVCQSCIDLAPDGSGNIDVIEIDAASHGGVDDARELRERAFQLPVASRYKIYIIDEAHMVSNQGFNALLKVVEEPPESVVFIFATTEPDKVLPTIRSRTHHYPFRLVPPAAMRDLLERNCVSEGVQVGPAVLPLVIRAGGGSVRDSQSLLDQLISGAGPDGITYEEALSLLGVTDAALLDDMVEAVGVGDGATVFGTVNRLIDAGHDPRRFGADLLDRLRDLILMAAVPDAGEKGLIDAPVDHLERLADQASRLGLSTLSRLADIVHVGLTEMRGTTAPRLGLELICARMLLPAVGDDGASMTQRIERLERRMEIGGLPAGDAGGRAPVRSGVESADPGRPRPADGLTPRQRAEAELTAKRGPRPQDPPPRPAPAEPAPAAPPSLAEPTAALGHAAPVEGSGTPERSTADRTTEGPAAGEPRPTGDRPSRPAARDGAPAPAGVPSATAPQHPPTEPAASAEAGWPQVKAPGSGRASRAVSASPPPAVTPAAPAEQPASRPVAPAAVDEPGPGAEAAATAQIGSAPFDIAEVRRQWRTVVDLIKRSSRATAALVETATPVMVRGESLVLTVPPALARRLADPQQHQPLKAALQDVFGVTWSVEVSDGGVQPPAGAGAGAPQRPDGPPPEDEDDFAPDPDDESVTDPRAGLDPGRAAVNLLRDELGAEEIIEQ